MSSDIKKWRDRVSMNDINWRTSKMTNAMQAEIDELRAALAAKTEVADTALTADLRDLVDLTPHQRDVVERAIMALQKVDGLCDKCGGSGEMHCVVGRPPDDYWDSTCSCDKCGGTGTACNAMQKVREWAESRNKKAVSEGFAIDEVACEILDLLDNYVPAVQQGGEAAPTGMYAKGSIGEELEKACFYSWRDANVARKGWDDSDWCIYQKGVRDGSAAAPCDRDAVLEGAAKVCDGLSELAESKQEGRTDDLGNVILRHHMVAHSNAADAIRSLKSAAQRPLMDDKSECNFCSRCGKRTPPGSIHTCTPPDTEPK